jgi:glycosyltransferase involved in cell wall biosynthesis
MTLPRLTVITPSLNQAQFLERTLLSVLDQQYPALEYIVMDGGSTDGSVEILERYDDRLSHWVSEPDAGQSWAINRGIERVTGDVIAYINSDDYYLPGAFAAAMSFFEDPAVRWVAGATEYREADGTLEELWIPRRPVGPRPRWVRSAWYVPQAASFWRRDVFEELGLLREDLSFVFDSEFCLRLALGGVLPRTFDRPLAVRYLHGEAKSARPADFKREWAHVARELRLELPRWERALDFAARFLYYPWRGRLGRLQLRERWRAGLGASAKRPR